MLFASTIETVQQSDHDKFMQFKRKNSSKELKEKILKTYHSEIKAFNQTKVNELSSHKKKDHKINLTFKSEPFFIKNYKSMSKQKLTVAKKYLDEHLKKKFIRANLSKATTLILFVKKLNDGLKFCVNYWKLNKIIEKNQYLIPLINEILTRLSKASMFIKLDVITAFNKIKIKVDQKWMIVFNIRYKQFEYLVLSFELCNAPSTF